MSEQQWVNSQSDTQTLAVCPYHPNPGPQQATKFLRHQVRWGTHFLQEGVFSDHHSPLLLGTNFVSGSDGCEVSPTGLVAPHLLPGYSVHSAIADLRVVQEPPAASSHPFGSLRLLFPLNVAACCHFFLALEGFRILTFRGSVKTPLVSCFTLPDAVQSAPLLPHLTKTWQLWACTRALVLHEATAEAPGALCSLVWMDRVVLVYMHE